MGSIPHIEWVLDSRPAVHRCGVANHADRDYSVIYHNDHFASIHIYEYSGTVKLGPHTFELAPGALTLTPIGCQLSYDLPSPGKHTYIHFTNTELVGATAELPLFLPPGSSSGWFRQKARDVLGYTKQETSPWGRVAANAALCEMIARIALYKGERTGPIAGERDYAERAADYLDHHFHEHIRVSDLVTKAQCSQNYLARCFKQRFGVTLQRYQLNRRMDRACELLLTTTLPIKVIGSRVGFADPQHFNKQFRHLTGVSPSSYRSTGR